MTKVKGGHLHKKRLKNLREQGAKMIAQALYAGGQEIEIYAERSITQGSISGAGHVPSLPGEPPNADTRQLDLSIHTDLVSINPPKVEVIADAPHAAYQEFGTSRMAERPYMRPALAAKKPTLLKLVEAAVRKSNNTR